MVAVLSGNRNFEGRIHGQVKASYLASPPLCVAYALAGTVMCDLTVDPLGTDPRRQARLPEGYLAHCRGSRIPGRILGVIGSVRPRIWPHIRRRREVEEHAGAHRHSIRLGQRLDLRSRAAVFHRFCRRSSTCPSDITGARVLALLGDSITTDHISPAGSITVDSPAGKYLVAHSVHADGVQQLWVPARQSRSHDARDVRQYSSAQLDGARSRGSPGLSMFPAATR